jgi:integrase
MPLTDTFVKNTKHSGKPAGDKYADGGGMYLLVKAAGKYWHMDYRFNSKRKTLSIGVYPSVSLAQARKARDAARENLAKGIEPSIAKREEKQARIWESVNTFEAVAREWLAKEQGKRAQSTHNKVANWLEKDVFPHIGGKPIATITPREVLVTLRHMEGRGALDSVQRVKQICGQVFRYGVATGLVERDITQDLRGALEQPARKHFAAITEPKQSGALLRSIHAYEGHPYTVAALMVSPLVFVRPGELRHAEWCEIDLETAEWRIPASKMKMGADHIVPLSVQAVDILRGMQALTGHGSYVFPSIRTGERPMSENTINAALRGMGIDQSTHTAHGFRAMARTIMDEVLNERIDLIEHQLAHAVKDANGRAYNRTAHLPARKAMMQRWADYLDTLRIGGNVVQFKRG